MFKVSSRIEAMSLSPTLSMSQKTREMKLQGIDVINLSVGEPDFNTPDHVKEAAKKAIDENFSYYSPVAGFDDLRQSIVEKFKRENSLSYTVKNIVVSSGAKQSIANVMLSIVNKGDQVVIPSPYWVSYVEIVKLAQGESVFIQTTIDNGFKISAEQLELALNEKTKAFLFSSPANPTGALYSKAELEALKNVFVKYPHVIILSDEIYEHINYQGEHESIAQFEELKDRVVVINGVSKAYAMTGWRIGYIAAPEWISAACIKLQGQYTSGASSIAQKAAKAALDGPNDCLIEMRDVFRRRRDLAFNALKQIKGFDVINPNGAFYFFINIKQIFGLRYESLEIKTATDLSAYLLSQARVATVTGEAFGNSNCLRLSYAVSEELMQEAIRRIKGAIDLLD